MDINITTSPDFRELAVIHTACFDAPWNEAALKEVLSIRGTFAFTWQKNGFGILRFLGNEAEIITLAVLPAVRQQGIAGAIVRHMIETAKKEGAEALFLEVRENNKAARTLYEKCGFAVLSRRRNYYRNTDNTYEDAIIMKKSL